LQFNAVQRRTLRTDRARWSSLNHSEPWRPRAANAVGLTALGEASPKPPGYRSDEDSRAISGPLTPVTSGLSRPLADRPVRRSGRVTGPDGAASQADSAGSIPVTRSTKKPQVRAIVGEQPESAESVRRHRVLVVRFWAHCQLYDLTVSTCLGLWAVSRLGSI
jgi:hypothetical protein